MMRRPLSPIVLLALLVVATACHGPVYEKPPVVVGGRPVREGPGPVVVENANLLHPGDAAYNRSSERWLAADHSAEYLVVRRGLSRPNATVAVSEQVPGNSQAVTIVDPYSRSRVYMRRVPSDTLEFPVHGRVVQVDPNGLMVVLSLTMNDPVRAGDHVTIMRAGHFVGYASLIDIGNGGTVALLLDAPGTTAARAGDQISIYTPQGPAGG